MGLFGKSNIYISKSKNDIKFIVHLSHTHWKTQQPQCAIQHQKTFAVQIKKEFFAKFYALNCIKSKKYQSLKLKLKNILSTTIQFLKSSYIVVEWELVNVDSDKNTNQSACTKEKRECEKREGIVTGPRGGMGRWSRGNTGFWSSGGRMTCYVARHPSVRNGVVFPPHSPGSCRSGHGEQPQASPVAMLKV